MNKFFLLCIWVLFFSNAVFADKLSKPFLNIGHSSGVISLDLSKNNRYLVSGGKDRLLKLWDTDNLKLLKTFKRQTSEILAVHFLKNNNYFLSGDKNGCIKLWDIQRGTDIKTFLGHRKAIYSFDVSTKGKYFLSGSNDGNILMWNIKSSSHPIKHFFRNAGVTNVKFVNNNLILASYTDGEIILWDVKSESIKMNFSGHKGVVYGLSIHNSKNYFVSTGTDRKIILWSIKNGEILKSYEEPVTRSFDKLVPPLIHRVKFFGNNLFLAGSMGYFTLWNPFTGKLKKDLNLNTHQYLYSMVINDNESFIGTRDGQIIKIGYVNKTVRIRQNLSMDVNDKYILTGNSAGLLDLWDIKTAKHVKRYKSKNIKNRTQIPSVSVAFFKDNTLLSVGTEGIVTIWNKNGYERGSVCQNNGILDSIRISNNNNSFIVAGDRNWIAQYDNKFYMIGDYSTLGIDPIFAAEISPDSKFIIAGGKDGKILYSKIELSDKKSNQVHFTNRKESSTLFELHKGNVYDVRISSNGRYALSGGQDGTVRLWNLLKRKNIKTFYHESEVHSIYLDNNGKYALSGGQNGSIKLWNLETKKLEKTFIGHQDQISSVAFDVKNKMVISTSYDGSVRLWDIKQGKELVNMRIFNDGEWLTITPEGYFTGSKDAAQYLNITKTTKEGLEPFDFSQLYDHFFRPDLVKLKLVGKEKEYQKAIAGMSYEEALKNPPPKISFKNIDTKTVKKSAFRYEDVNTSQEKVKLSFNVSEHDGGGIGLIRVYQEGKLVQTIGEGEIHKQSANLDTLVADLEKDTMAKKEQSKYLLLASKSLTSDVNMSIEDTISPSKQIATNNKAGLYNIELELKSGKNEISIEAFNKTNTVTSYRENITINAAIPKHQPKLYAIVVGVNHFQAPNVKDLKYSQNDAKAIKEVAQKQMGKIFSEVEVKYLIGEDVTNENIFKAAKEISKKARLEDTVLFYISTHGRNYKGNLYLLPYNNLKVKDWINFEQIFKAIQSIKALNQVFIIDACESGQANDIVSSVYDSRASVLAKSAGVHVLLATTKGTFAFEHPDKKVKHGVFTNRILEALKDKKTDTNKDSFISILELSKKLQEPANNTEYQYPVIRNVGSDIQLEKIK